MVNYKTFEHIQNFNYLICQVCHKYDRGLIIKTDLHKFHSIYDKI